MAQPNLLNYTPDVTAALLDAFVGIIMADPGDIPAHDPAFITAKYLLNPLQNEVLALLASNVADPTLRQLYTCTSADVVGAPVRISDNNTVELANSTDAAHADVVAFVRSKPSTTTCYLQHFIRVTGLTGGTYGAPAYLSDAGAIAATPGTFVKTLGKYISSTSALLIAGPGLSLDAPIPRSASISIAGSQSIPNNADTALTFDTIDYDPTGLATLTPTSYLLAPDTGIYAVDLGLTWASNPTGDRELVLSLGGYSDPTMRQTAMAAPTRDHAMQISVVRKLNQYDVVAGHVIQTSGGALNVAGARLSMIRVG